MIHHIVSMSGGKDSLACYLLALERGKPFRALSADVGNESPRWREYVESIGRITGGPDVEIIQADFSDRFEERRLAIARDWATPLVRKRHLAECKARPYAERKNCDCPVNVAPAVPPERIAQAIEAMQPTGNPFLDLCLLKGRFPGAMSRFCTDDLKLKPMMEIKQPLLDAGESIVSWIGERADESKARAKKPMLERIRHQSGACEILYRPIHGWTAEQTFELAKRHGMPPNPLYLQGMKRVGCFTCIMAGKEEIKEWAVRFPEAVDRIEEWERLVTLTSRRWGATFFCAKVIPGEDPVRANIRNVVRWANSGKGGNWQQFDFVGQMEAQEAADAGLQCKSSYGLCE